MYDHRKIELKWQKKWAESHVFEVDLSKAKKPFYNLMMFPYPSGEGLHVGHVFTFGGIDTFGRFKRMQGYQVFEPMGFDAFGIHSENYAIKVGKHPKDLTVLTVENMRENQLKKLGALFDWRYEVNTSNPEYYKWTQWLFLQLYKADLAERKKAPVNFCPSCKTVLADEQVIGGKCERCDSLVERRELEQWFIKITKYADRLLENLESIDWSDTTKTLQKNWIGRKEGINIRYKVVGTSEEVICWTSRPDTNFGATFIVLAPENPQALRLSTGENIQKVKKYIEKSQKKSDVERVGEGREKTGVFTGSYAVNDLTGEKMPIWVSDFVLAGFGTGAVVGVPGHDRRDFEFAKKFVLPIRRVVIGKDGDKSPIGKIEQVQEEEGLMVNSGFLDGLDIHKATKKVMDHLEKKGWGKRETNYHLRDWLISRQRYWGPPIPIIYCDKCGTVPVPEKDLPVLLPELEDFQPKGKGVSPLATLASWVNVTCPNCGGEARRETDVSDTFLDSSWYFLRYPSVRARNSGQVPYDRELTKKWLPVDSYIGGNEHASLHLLYTRFITMALHDMGLIDFEEPFKKFRYNGLIIHKGAKMSKSRGNVVNPNEYMEKYGIDALRMYLLFIGPFDQGGDFSDLGISGVYRFVRRVWTLGEHKPEQGQPESGDLSMMHRTIKRVGDDIENLRFNTAVAALMEYLNYLSRKKSVKKQEVETFSLLLAPLAPHLAEEVWQMVGNSFSVHTKRWPKYQDKYLKAEKATLIIQVNGKVRDQFSIDVDGGDDLLKKTALESGKVKKYILDKKIKSVIIVPTGKTTRAIRLVNIVTD